MTQIAIASGKGGTGKTTLAVHLASRFARDRPTILADLDVEAPDSWGYFPSAVIDPEIVSVDVMVPRHDASLCIGCGACAKSCRFGAIFAVGKTVGINASLCKGCGRCVHACTAGALVEGPVKVGTVQSGHAGSVGLVQGLLEIGDIRSTVVIEAAKKRAASMGADIIVRDCPPGATCPTVRAVHGADFCLLVAEPTPFSLHDLENALKMVKTLGIPAGIVINKAGAGNGDIREFAKRHGTDVLGQIGWKRRFAEAGSRGELFPGDADFETALSGVIDGVTRMLEGEKA